MVATRKKKMNSGVAKAIREVFPDAYTAYMAEPTLTLGQTIWVKTKGKIIINAITQKYYGYDGKKYVSEDAIDFAFRTINAYVKEKCQDFGDLGDAIALPRIGSKLGGGDWNVIEKIIENACTDIQPIVYDLPE